MSNMCLIVTPSIKKVADQIKQEYPKACERNGFTDQMCAEWVGLYNNTNSQNPDNVPSMKSLVNFIEKLRNQEGKSFLRDLEEEKRQYDIEQEMANIKAKAIADGTFMKAPNGKNTNLTERQWLQVRTQNFINWFGDWINDPANASKVVDENGEPLVVYHHTDNPNLTKFSTDFENYFAKDGGTKEAIFFDEEKTGTLNRKYDLPVFLNIRELNEYNETKQQLHDRGTTYREIVNNSAKKNNKTGGVHMKDFDDNRKEHQSIWIIHNPNQVKSATDNNGQFSSSNDNINDDYENVNSFAFFNEIIDKLQTLYGINIIPITNAELSQDRWASITGTKGVKSFIYNGNIYINTDIATVDSPVHEFLHLLFGSMKYQNRALYNTLVGQAEQFDSYDTISQNYPNRTRGDINEEVFVTELAKYLTGQKNAISNLEQSAQNEIIYNVNRTLDTVLMGENSVKCVENPYIMNLKTLAKLVNSSTMISEKRGSLSDATLNRMMANTKSELMKNKELKEECQ